MLAQIQSLLIKYHYISLNETCYISGRLLGNWGLLVYTSAGQYFHIKVETQNVLVKEYRQLTKLHEQFTSFMAQPKGYYEWEGRGYLINQAIAHKPFLTQEFLHNTILQESVAAYFSLTFENDIQMKNVQNPEQNEFKKQLFHNPHSFMNNHHIEHIQNLHQKLMIHAPQYQHGDFVLNNLGVHNKKLVIFDWEDYGKILLPGFDLATFLLSLYQFDTNKLVNELYCNSIIQKCVNHYMSYLESNIEDFVNFMPLYLYAFLYIKQQFGYSKDSILRTQESISQLYKLKK